MTLATIDGTTLVWPVVSMFTAGGGTPIVNSTASTLDAAGEYHALIFCAREDMTISHVGINVTATGSPTLDVRIETVDASGLPSGTLWNTNTNVVTGTLSTGMNVVALTASASITKGQIFCVKFLYNSGTSIVIRCTFNLVSPGGSVPYNVINTGSPVKSILQAPISGVLGSGATTFYNVRGLFPITNASTGGFNNTSSARRGLRFQIPFKCRCVGIRNYTTTNNGNFNYALYDDAGAELSSSSTAFDGDHSALSALGFTELYFDNAVTLSPATWYRAAIEPTSATNTTMFTFTLPSADYRKACPFGTNAHYTTYVASSWTDTATDQIPYLDILIDQLDDGAGAGSTGSQRVING